MTCAMQERAWLTAGGRQHGACPRRHRPHVTSPTVDTKDADGPVGTFGNILEASLRQSAVFDLTTGSGPSQWARGGGWQLESRLPEPAAQSSVFPALLIV